MSVEMKSAASSLESRRQWMFRTMCALAGGAAVLAVTPAQAKMSQKAAGYQLTAKDGQNCANCSLYRAPSACTLIDGDVTPNGWCRYYSRK